MRTYTYKILTVERRMREHGEGNYDDLSLLFIVKKEVFERIVNKLSVYEQNRQGTSAEIKGKIRNEYCKSKLEKLFGLY